MAMGGGKRNRGDMAEAVAFFCAVLLFLWFLARPLPWTGVGLLVAVVFSWRRRALTAGSLGLGWKELCHSVRSWSVLWVFAVVLFVALGHRVLFRLPALEQGCVYFAWAAAQQVVYQSMMYMPLRNNLRSRGLAAGLSGLAFALVHVPNPVLVAGTLVWGVGACLLFERCRSVWGLALMQVMLSSMLFWVTPAELNRNFRIGPYYYEIHSQKAPGATFAPPIETPR
jgi:hypothetical protein